jgi:hypothetical protein
MTAVRTTELSTSLLHKDDSSSYSLRIVECRGVDGMICHKFAIIESWYCDKSACWVPVRKQHSFAPLSAWPKLVAHGQLITNLLGCIDGAMTQEKVSDTTEPISNGNIATSKKRGQPSKRANCANAETAPTGPGSDGPRGRGRPPKCVTNANCNKTQQPCAAEKSARQRCERPSKRRALSPNPNAIVNSCASVDAEARQFLEEETVHCGDGGTTAGTDENTKAISTISHDVEKPANQ